jgi:hypothetical protein
MRRLYFWIALLGAFVLMSSGQTVAASDEPAKSDEYLLLGSPNRGAGEPWVFVNPKDPKNIIVVAMATLNRLPTGEAPLPRTVAAPRPGAGGPPSPNPARTALRIKELSTPDGSRTDIAISRDGGNTWSFSEDDLRKIYQKNRCSDSFAGASPDGTLYMGCLAYLNRGGADYEYGWAPNGEAWYYHGGSAIESSKDKGATWSRPVWVHPALSPSLYAPTVHPVFEQASPWDRPVFIADASTNTIYVTGSGPAYTVDPKTVSRPKRDPNVPGGGYTGYPSNAVSRSRTFVRASHDNGRTWGTIYTLDSDQFPGRISAIGGVSAAHGNLVVAYSSDQVPTSTGATCPCTVLGISRDDGKTFDYKIVPPLPADLAGRQEPGAGGARGGVMIAADPTRDGRYAVARIVGNRIVVSLTLDTGATWSAPDVAAELPAHATFGHHTMKYSPQGALGIIWKAAYPDRTFDVWSAVSRDSGKSFKTIRISHEVSPQPILERDNFGMGDDLSSMDIDGDFLYAVWGDHRSGFQGTWFGRVPLSEY